MSVQGRCRGRCTPCSARDRDVSAGEVMSGRCPRGGGAPQRREGRIGWDHTCSRVVAGLAAARRADWSRRTPRRWLPGRLTAAVAARHSNTSQSQASDAGRLDRLSFQQQADVKKRGATRLEESRSPSVSCHHDRELSSCSPLPHVHLPMG